MLCVHCERPVAGTVEDPVVAGKGGYMHYACFRSVSSTRVQAEKDRREASRARRSAAMRAAWEKKRQSEDAPTDG